MYPNTSYDGSINMGGGGAGSGSSSYLDALDQLNSSHGARNGGGGYPSQPPGNNAGYPPSGGDMYPNQYPSQPPPAYGGGGYPPGPPGGGYPPGPPGGGYPPGPPGGGYPPGPPGGGYPPGPPGGGGGYPPGPPPGHAYPSGPSPAHRGPSGPTYPAYTSPPSGGCCPPMHGGGHHGQCIGGATYYPMTFPVRREFVVKDTASMWSDAMNVYDEHQHIVIRALHQPFSWGHQLQLVEECSKRPLLYLSQKFGGKYKMLVDGRKGTEYAVFKSEFSLFTAKFSVKRFDGEEFHIVGEFMSRVFQITQRDRLVAEVRKCGFSWAGIDTYSVIIAPNQDCAFILGLCVILDKVRDDRRKAVARRRHHRH